MDCNLFLFWESSNKADRYRGSTCGAYNSKVNFPKLALPKYQARRTGLHPMLACRDVAIDRVSLYLTPRPGPGSAHVCAPPRPIPVVPSILISLVRRCALTRVPRVHRMSRTAIAHPASHSAHLHCQPVCALLG